MHLQKLAGKKRKKAKYSYPFFLKLTTLWFPCSNPPTPAPPAYAFKILQRLVKKLNGIWHLQKNQKGN